MQLASPLGTAVMYNAGGEELWDGELKGPTSRRHLLLLWQNTSSQMKQLDYFSETL
jgi:hypothetical protein